MKNYIHFLISTVILGGCASTVVEKKHPDLTVTHGELKTTKWEMLNRFPAAYPKKAAMTSIEGCATIEYVITPQNEIKDIRVVASTNTYFAKSAENVIKKWKWSKLPQNITLQPIKTQTRFDFCFDKPNQSCATINPEYSCPSDDVIYSRGMHMGTRIIKVRS